MKASELIKLLQQEIAKEGDKPIQVHFYGWNTTTPDNGSIKVNSSDKHIYLNISTKNEN